MKKIFTAVFLVLGISIFTGTINEAKASHAMGADLTYTCIGNNIYQITLKFYRDCAGVSAPPSAPVVIRSVSCNITLNVTLQQDILNSGIEVSPLCPQQIQYSSCNGGSLPGVQVYTYTGTVTLPAQCADWEVSWVHCCRNGAITNLATKPSMYINAFINNTNAVTPCNSSPTFSNLPVPYICAGQAFNYNHGIIEPNGDSLIFTMIAPMNTGAAPIAFAAGYSITNPVITTNNQFTVDPLSGQMTFTPSGPQVCVLAMRVCEYRNGQLVGCSMRDIQVVVLNCSNKLPYTNYYTNMTGGGQITDSNSLEVCPGDTLKVQIHGLDQNANDILNLTSNIAAAIPGASYTTTGTNPVIGHFTWAPSVNDTGRHYFNVSIKDNACPILGQQNFSFDIKVNKGTFASPDIIMCQVGGPQIISVYGGNTFSWTPKYGILSAAPDSSWIEVYPNTTTDYIVTSDYSSLCKNKDTVRVNVVPSFNYNLSPNDTICKFQESQITLVCDPTYGPYSYQWTPDDSLTSATVSSPIATPLLTKQYNVEITSAQGCKVNDSILIHVIGESPRVSIAYDKNYLCPNPIDEAHLQVLAAPGSCGPSLFGCTGTSSNYTLGDGTSVTGAPTPYEGYYKYARMQILYTANDLNALGIRGGTISAISFDVGLKESTQPFQNFTIRMGCTSMNTLPSEFQTGLYTVYGPTQMNTVQGWNTHTLSSTYDWDGYSNLIVEICHTNNAGFSNDDDVLYTPTTYTSVIYKFGDSGGPGCALTSPQLSTSRPNTRFSVCSMPLTGFGINWTPTIGISPTNSDKPTVRNIPQTMLYTVEVDNNGCLGFADIEIELDSTRMIARDDTLLCALGPVQLTSEAVGTAPLISMNCGTNGTVPVFPSTFHNVGAGVNSFGGTLFPANQEDMRFQILVKASELQLMGMKAGIITDFSFELSTKLSTNAVQNLTISMDCSSVSTLNTTAFEPNNNVVFSALTYNTVAGWNNFILTNPFDWDGSASLVIDICWDNPNGTPLNGTDNLMTHDLTFNGISRKYGTGGSGCTTSPPSVAYTKRPNLRLGISPPPPGVFTYTWTQISGTPGSLSATDIPNPIANPSNSSSYVVSITSKFDCTITDTVNINVSLMNTTISPDTAVCAGQSVTLNATGGDNFVWSPSQDVLFPTSPTTLATPSMTTVFSVTIIDSVGCRDDKTTTVTINPIPVVDAGPDENIFIGQSVTLNGIGGPGWSWSPGESLSDPTIANPTATPVWTTTYTLDVLDPNGCRSMDTMTVFVESLDDIYVPTAFSPNNDGVNDLYYPVPKGIVDLVEFKIYNRWGQQVFHTNDFANAWDGIHNGEKQEIGTYIYVIIGYDYLGQLVTRKGNLVLLR